MQLNPLSRLVCSAILLFPAAYGCGGPTNDNVPTRVVTEDELPKPGEIPPPPGSFAPKELSPPEPVGDEQKPTDAP